MYPVYSRSSASRSSAEPECFLSSKGQQISVQEEIIFITLGLWMHNTVYWKYILHFRIFASLQVQNQEKLEVELWNLETALNSLLLLLNKLSGFTVKIALSHYEAGHKEAAWVQFGTANLWSTVNTSRGLSAAQ